MKNIDRPGGAAAALARKASGATPADPALPEYIVNLLGYEHLALKDTGTAVDIMKLNAATYPASANAEDSLGDAYLAAGDTASALAAARRTLELLAADTQDTAERKAIIRDAAAVKIAKLSAR